MHLGKNFHTAIFFECFHIFQKTGCKKIRKSNNRLVTVILNFVFRRIVIDQTDQTKDGLAVPLLANTFFAFNTICHLPHQVFLGLQDAILNLLKFSES